MIGETMDRAAPFAEGDATGRKRLAVELGLTDRAAPEGAHIMYVYNDDEERRQSMVRFLSAGLAARERLLYLVHDMSPAEKVDELLWRGLDAETLQHHLDITRNHLSHCPGHRFSREIVLDMVGRFYDEAIEDGFAGARGSGEMTWAAAGGSADIQELLRYEAELNAVLADHPLTTVCQYDARMFPGEVIMDLLSVHPLAIVRGQLVENPNFSASPV